jgi:hypothetical protein
MRPTGLALALVAAGAPLASGASAIRFDEVAARAGLASFRHVSGSPDKRYIAEVMSGGVCAADFDRDGWVDVFLVNGGSFETLRGAAPPPHALFRNRGDGTFENVTGTSGVTNAGWGMGCAVADYDGDGQLDLYVTYYRAPNQLWRNRGGARFDDVTARSGAGGARARWNAGATFGDFDRDGDLDLFVSGYVALDPTRLPDPAAIDDCRFRGLVVNCGPRGLPGEGDLLFRNDGDGTFTDVTAANHIDPERHYGLGAVFLPLAAGEAPSLYVANDSTPNHLYQYRAGRLVERAFEAGVAVSDEGREQAGMGIAWGDYDADGRLDLYVTNFVDDYNTLYRHLGDGLYEDATRRAQLAQPTRPYMGWGAAFADFDHDGRDDVAVANGHVYPQIDTLKLPAGYQMPLQVFRNAGDGAFQELPRDAAPGLAVSRGLAIADFWNDGRAGFVVNNLDGTPWLFGPAADTGRFIELLLDAPRNPGAIGAWVEITWPGGRAVRIVASGGSYLSSGDLRVHAGVGAAEKVTIEVTWPDGRRQRITDVPTSRIYHLVQGTELTETTLKGRASKPP